MNVKELAKEQESYVIQCRHYLHSHPELSTKEVNTTRFIKEELEKMGCRHLCSEPLHDGSFPAGGGGGRR